MDFRPMLNSDRFAYFTDQEKEYLLTVYLPRRGSDFSRSNLLYILGAFSSQLEKPLFDVSSKDASLYTKFLIGNIEEKIWREQYALTVFNTLQNFYLFCYKQEKIKENPFGQISFPVLHPGSGSERVFKPLCCGPAFFCHPGYAASVSGSSAGFPHGIDCQ